MDVEEFRKFGKAAVDYIADYMDNIREKDVLPSISPGYCENLIPKDAPQKGESWQEVLKDMDQIIMPGITHWQSPNFHAYYPTACSFPGIVGEMLSAGIGCIGLSWIGSPAYTELEVIMMNWLGKLLNLPEKFLNSSDGPGGGIIQGSASEVTFIALLVAKDKKVRELATSPMTEAEIKGKLIAYSSDQSNSSVEKSGLLASVPMRLLPADKNGVLRGETLEKAIQEDKAKGLIPCYVVANLGTTPTCAFDNLEEMGPICEKENIWLHVDAAYAGTAFVCPEYRYLMKGVEYAHSFNFNPHKWMLVNFDCSAMWVSDAKYLVEAFSVERIYLEDQHKGLAPEYRHWQISLGRRFRALKLWFVLRIYGVEGIQKHVRHQISLARYFEELCEQDPRFRVCSSSMGLVCFNLKDSESLTKTLYENIKARKKIFMSPGSHDHSYVIRFVICSRLTEKRDVDFAWSEIRGEADKLLGVKLPKIIDTVAEKGLNELNISSERCDNLCKREKIK